MWTLSSFQLLILIRECVEACGSLVPMCLRSSIHKFLGESYPFTGLRLNKSFWNIVGEFWFLLVLWTSCNVLINTSLREHSGGIYLCMNVSGDVFDEVVSHSLMSMLAAFLSKLTSVKMNKTSSWCQRFCVLSDVQSGSKSKLCSSGRDARHWCFGTSTATTERVQERQCGFGQS